MSEDSGWKLPAPSQTTAAVQVNKSEKNDIQVLLEQVNVQFQHHLIGNL
jgi:hypothetical protein